MATTALLDADVMLYKAACVSEINVSWDGVEEPSTMLLTPTAKDIIHTLVNEWAAAAKCDRYKLVFSDPVSTRTFRYQVHPAYKANRPTERPALVATLRKYLEDTFPNTNMVGLEGDDVMGLLATGPTMKLITIVSIDKDMLTIPGRLVNPDGETVKDEKGQSVKKATIQTVTSKQADYNWMLQTLMGDVVDGFLGCPGVGIVKAQRALAAKSDLGEMWPAVLELFQDQFEKPSARQKFVQDDPLKEALMNARCARILRWGDWDATKGVKLWHPDKTQAQWITTKGAKDERG